jgi:hypothetical protein
LTAGLVLILVFVLLLSRLLPQSSTAPDAATWITGLPSWLQPWGAPLYVLGAAHLLGSLWFWLPAALLLLNSLIALADCGPGVWQRLDKTMPPLKWRHPLARRIERVVRLPQDPDSFLEKLQTALGDQGFFIYQLGESEQRLVAAARRRWAWLSFGAIYGGLVLLVVAFLISTYFLQIEHLTLVPLEPEISRLLDGSLELGQTPADRIGSRITFLADEGDQPESVLAWRLYQPVLFNSVLIWPIERAPILVVEVADETGDLLRLIPVQEDLAPAQRLNLPLTEAGKPLYFLIPSAKLAVQISPDPTVGQDAYNVQVRRSSEDALLVNTVIRADQTLTVENLSMTMLRHHSLTVLAYSDPAFFLYIVAFLLILAGILVVLLRPPMQIWLIPEVKGLGGQLHGLLETPTFFVKAKTTFLEKLLAKEDRSEPNAESSTSDKNST